MAMWVPSWFLNPDHRDGTEGVPWLSAYSCVVLGTVVPATVALRVQTDGQTRAGEA